MASKRKTSQPAAPPPIWPVAAGLAVLVILIYARTLGFGFINYDDDTYVFGNPHVTPGLTLGGIAWAFTSWSYVYWFPLSWLSHMLDVELFGLNPGPHHFASIALHAANAVLVFLFLHRTTKAYWPSATAAALFACHPLRVESVAWIAERKDVLSGFFFLLALLAYERWRMRRGIVLICAALAMMAKPMAVTLPIALLLVDAWPLGRTDSWRARVIEKWPLFLMSGAIAVVTWLGQKQAGAMDAVKGAGFPLRLENAVVSLGRYLWLTVWPHPLALLYPYEKQISVGALIASAVALIGITYLAIRWRKQRPYVLVGWLWFLMLLLPVLGIVQVGPQSMADRFTYLPSIGLFFAVVWTLKELPYQRQLAYAAAGAIGLLALAAWVQTGYWHDGITAFTHAVQVAPENPVALENLTAALDDRGDFVTAARYGQEAVRTDPASFLGYYNLGKAQAGLGHTAEALACFEKAVRLKPDLANAQYGRAMMLQNLGRVNEAIEAWKVAVDLPLNTIFASDAHNNLGALKAQSGDVAGARAEFAEAIRINPENANARRNWQLSTSGK